MYMEKAKFKQTINIILFTNGFCFLSCAAPMCKKVYVLWWKHFIKLEACAFRFLGHFNNYHQMLDSFWKLMICFAWFFFWGCEQCVYKYEVRVRKNFLPFMMNELREEKTTETGMENTNNIESLFNRLGGYFREILSRTLWHTFFLRKHRLSYSNNVKLNWLYETQNNVYKNHQWLIWQEKIKPLRVINIISTIGSV